MTNTALAVDQEPVILEAPAKLTIGQGDVVVRDAVLQALDEGYRSIILDLRGVKRIDSAGVGELVAAHLGVVEAGGRLALCGLSPRVGGVLAATCLVGVLEVHGSLESAILGLAA